MVWVEVGVTVAAAVVTVWAAFTVRQVRRELAQSRLLYVQMEEDHGELVRQHLAWRKSVGR